MPDECPNVLLFTTDQHRGDGFADGEKLLVRQERWGPVVES